VGGHLDGGRHGVRVWILPAPAGSDGLRR
jgi:hypothetical protein